MIASILRRTCYFLRAFLVQVQLQVALVWGCMLYRAPDAAEVLSATERGEIDVPLVYIVLSLKEKTKINMCLCSDKEVSTACTQSFNLTAVMYPAY